MLKQMTTAGALAATVLLAAQADARTAAATTGMSRLAASQGCFQGAAGAVTNICATAQFWMMPLIYDDDGWRTIKVHAMGAHSAGVCCSAHSRNSEGGDLRPVSLGCTGPGPQVDEISADLQLHGWGTSWVQCTVPFDTRVYSYHW